MAELLDELAEPRPVPAGGSAAALAAAMAARLVSMAARSTTDWPSAAACSAQALTLSARLEPLALADAQAYAAALQALEDRDRDLGEALHRAAELPLAIAQCAADVAELAAETAESCAGHVRGEALAAVALARGAAEAAGRLVEINLASSADDARSRHAADLVRAARDAWERTAGR
jgi:formiminotetrahydrofolate cyclodeaminase